ncbi:fasciclin domain-containing protein [Prevotella sp. E13-27]|uniref:fasciclin domain-containing protein n=1 Tax=Prevotella sp. E13-27 TaxID=2938122 RepID=UPI00200A7DD8|nr:fasciclin domain-containing protein [Prevotella sp. E13-27]MCK8621203.1 fasciclin domain-containing protein [Prevotella sp. E13-27]
MKKTLFCVSLALAGLMSSCVDKYEEVDADSQPSWLGGSIYAELENPKNLTGTFKTYLRLVDDLGYAETLNRTGSKTIFPANDEAFSRFFQKNDWGVSSYEELTEAQKKLLLYSSMLDNALLISLLPNVSNGTNTPMKGQALKHPTNISTTDSIQFEKNLPGNNTYWDQFRQNGIHVVSDNTTPMMVHLLREYMIYNGISTVGENSDFEIITGTPFTNGTAYIFNNKILKSDVTCQNGYIQQMENVLLPPGNMAQVIRKNNETKLISRMLDYFSAPYYDATTTKAYNDWAQQYNRPKIDSIYQWRYLSNRSQGGEKLGAAPAHMGGTLVSGSELLDYDPGWNGYYPKTANASANIDYAIMDMGAFFVPTDEAVKKYFLPGGNGAYLIDIYGTGTTGLPNTEENLERHIDSIAVKNKAVIASFLKNLMKDRFSNTVPSKFETIINDAGENFGMTTSKIHRKDGKYDISIANNGAVYVIDELLAPDEYQAVLAPTSVYPDMRVMGWAVQDGIKTGDYLGVDFKYYLLAMSANYAFFVPEDRAFGFYYLDPATLGHLSSDNKTPRPDVLYFHYEPDSKVSPLLKCERYYYNVTTGEIEGAARPVTISEVKTQLVDILNYHTLVLNSGELIGKNHFYKTKHGGAIYVDGHKLNGRVMGEWQKNGKLFGRDITSDVKFKTPEITEIFDQKNGKTYRLDRVVQPPVESVYSVLKSNTNLSEFLKACEAFGNEPLLKWANISPEESKDANGNKLGYSEQDAYIIFTNKYVYPDPATLKNTTINQACPDYNVKMFKTYNYTLFAPDNTAMTEAYANGLPNWVDVQALWTKYGNNTKAYSVLVDSLNNGHLSPDERTAYLAELADRNEAKRLIGLIRDFVKYHFMVESVFADENVEPSSHSLSLCTDAIGAAKELSISGGAGKLNVKDATKTLTIDANDSGKVVNKMCRDYWYNTNRTKATSIETSSFCTVHQISRPLCANSDGRFD